MTTSLPGRRSAHSPGARPLRRRGSWQRRPWAPCMLCVMGAVTFVCLPFPVVAQSEGGPEVAPPTGPVFSLGGGVGSYGPAVLVSFGFPAWRGELIVRAGGTADPGELGEAEAAGDVGVLLGFRRSGDRFWARFGAGPGLVGSDSPCGDSNVSESCGETQTGIGLSGQVDAVWAFHRRAGLGVTLFGAIGSDDAGYGAVSLGLFFGWGG